MSGTRSHSRKAQATDLRAGSGPSALIVSHGQPSEPEVAEAELAELVPQVQALLPGWTVRGATLAAEGRLSVALSDLGPGALVYPLFMTDGWFTQTNLRRRLGDAPVTMLRPLGVDPALVDLAEGWLRAELERSGWDAGETTLVLAAHGSGRSPNAARDTLAFAHALAGKIAFADIRPGYVEETPYLAASATGLGEKSICLPFFATRRGHVLFDVPAALDEAGFGGLRLPPIGLHAGISGLIAQALLQAEKEVARQ